MSAGKNISKNFIYPFSVLTQNADKSKAISESLRNNSLIAFVRYDCF